MENLRARRLKRAAASASVTTFIALLAHAVAGGPVPGMLALATLWMTALLIAMALGGTRLSLWRLIVVVTLSQFAFHELFAWSAGSGGAVAGHVHSLAEMQSLMAGAASTAVVASAAMWLSHLVAGVLTVVALHSGERMLQRTRALAESVAAWLRRRIRAIAAPALGRPRLARTAFGLRARALPVVALGSLSRRGPPALAVV